MSGSVVPFWVIVIWVALVGGCVGSFLNVVVYRLPLGLSLSRPGSHCPKCKSPIRWHDNVPVIGWLALGGQCRDCAARISLRYPAVEALVGALFVIVTMVEGFSGGANLPVRPVPVAGGMIYPALSSGELAGLVGWHLLLLCTLLAAALIRYDGQAAPARLFLPALLVGCVGSLAWPHLHPQPAALMAGGPTPGAIDGLAGLAVGGMMGAATWRLFGRTTESAAVWSCSLVGLFLGWQAAAIVVTAAIGCHAVGLLLLGGAQPAWQRAGPTGWLAFGSLAWIAGWAGLADLLSSP